VSRPLILVADDSATVRAVLGAQLAGAGYAVVPAADGREALARLREDRPDVALLDIEMPELDGLAVLEEMQADPVLATVPVLFLTGRAEAQDVAAGLARGAHDYVRKPIEATELTARVRAALRVKALADELRRRNAELERLACTDHLTGARNRRFTAGELERLVARGRRHGHAVSVALLDVDHFKAINDRHGHDAGDAVLAGVAARMAGRLRRDDVVGRWGGEEFLVLLPETGAAGAARVAEDVRAVIAAEPFAVEGGPVPVTASVGWATWDGDETGEALLRRADAGLYSAKAAGRNTVRPAAPPVSAG
jgi:two-component system, cell cycle response regulator